MSPFMSKIGVAVPCLFSPWFIKNTPFTPSFSYVPRICGLQCSTVSLHAYTDVGSNLEYPSRIWIPNAPGRSIMSSNFWRHVLPFSGSNLFCQLLAFGSFFGPIFGEFRSFMFLLGRSCGLDSFVNYDHNKV